MPPTEKNLQAQVDQLLKDNERLRQQNEQSKAAYDQLLFQLKEMMRHRFGQRSARFIDPDNPQANLFEEIKESEADKTTDEGDSDSVVDINT